MPLPFVVTLRGYDMGQVETLFAEVDGALAADSAGYEVQQVDAAIDERLRAL